MEKGMDVIDTDVGKLSFYKSLPNGPVKGGLIVIHEVWGLDDHIKDVADRFASAGYYVVAPDLLEGTDVEKLVTPDMFKKFSDPDQRSAVQVFFRKVMAPLSSPEFSKKTVDRLKELFKWLREQPQANGKVAVVGFCFGGTYSYALATVEPDLVASVPFYGHSDQGVDALKQVKCPVLAFYGEDDEHLIGQLPDLIDKMQQAGVKFKHKVYPGAGHAFFNDQNPLTYREDAAGDSWNLTLEFLDANFNKVANSR